MKKILITIFIIIILLLVFVKQVYLPTFENETSDDQIEEENIDKKSVSYNGWLHTNGYKLENENNEEVQLVGLSSHGIEWFSDVITYENLEELKNNWNINVFRIAMYTDADGQGYIYNQQENKEKVYEIVDMAIDLDMYVIIDWHILDDNNPNQYKEEAKIFFSEVSEKYSNIPNVIYEICNEPNGNDVTWKDDIKPYAEEIIPIIRNNSENSLIIVGTPDWCKKINKVVDSPLEFSNVVYACHFYSGTHGSELRDKIDYCIQNNIPVFVSECGLTEADGNGQAYYDEFNEWIDYLDSKNISWVYWSFSNKDETSAMLLPEYTVSNNESSDNESNTVQNNTYNESATALDTSTELQLDFNEYLTDAGEFIKNILKQYN